MGVGWDKRRRGRERRRGRRKRGKGKGEERGGREGNRGERGEGDPMPTLFGEKNRVPYRPCPLKKEN